MGGERRRALTFYAGMRRDRFYARLPIHAQAHMLARAAGHGGSGAAYAVIIGEQELAGAVGTVRPLRAEFGAEQETVGRADLVTHLTKLLPSTDVRP